MTDLVAFACGVAGVVFLVAGATKIHPGLGMIVAGVLLISLAKKPAE